MIKKINNIINSLPFRFFFKYGYFYKFLTELENSFFDISKIKPVKKKFL